MAALGAASALALFLPVSAGAQYYPPPPPAYPAYPTPGFGLMPPHEADALVRSLGLTPIAEPRVHGPVILIQAMGQEGSQVRVTVDRRNGRVRQIVRIGPPQVATLPPGPQYDTEAEETMPVPPRPLPNAGYAPYPSPPSGPQVITRDGIQSQGLPPLGPEPRVVTREPEITGSVPRTAPPRSVDPLMGVPPEFRNRAGTPAKDDRVAARAPEQAAPRVTPMPRPRPADAPTVARRDPAPTLSPAKPEAVKPAAPETAAKPAQPSGDTPVQGLE
jgi:hypothetical protein